ncbi:hypothetical protein [Candidatus Palauibacter sp.]|uniref:hypothetical protein n=1 Tax=Candidatus Palauibacter sp. TaxID=3101350 RepID=UPI003AF31630
MLGVNLLLGTAILAQPGQAASASAAACQQGDCLCECAQEWGECVVNGGWDCNIRFSRCINKKCIPV